MRNATWLGSLLLLATLSATGRAASDADLVVAKCSNGLVTVTAKAPWHPNPEGPWVWDKGSLVSRDATQVKFKGPKCEGTVKAFIASGNQFKGPIRTPVK
jgi:hypothetical protein